MSHAPHNPRAQRVLLILLAAILAAVALGVAIRGSAMAGLLDGLGPAGALKPWIAALGAPWLIVAWLLGALAGRVWLSAAAGAAAVVLGTVAWYVLTLANHYDHVVHKVVGVAASWILLGLASGALLGAAGALFRAPPARHALMARALGAAVPAGCLVGEAVLLSGEWAGRAPAFVLRLELAVGLALPVVLLRGRPGAVLAGVALTLVIAVGAFVGEDAAREFARSFGWSGR